MRTFVLSRNVLFLIYTLAQLKAIVCVDMAIFNHYERFFLTKIIYFSYLMVKETRSVTMNIFQIFFFSF